MANYTTYGDASPTNTGGSNYAGAPVQTVFVGEYDASKRTLTSSGSDTAEIMTLPANCVVRGATVEVLTVDGTGNILVGTVANEDGFVTASEAADAAALVTYVGAGALLNVDIAAEVAVTIAPSTADLDTLKCRVILEVTILG